MLDFSDVVVNIEDSRNNRRASAVVPASPRHGDQQVSQFTGNEIGSYSQHTFAPVNLQVHPADPTIVDARRPSGSATYQYSPNTGPREIAYRQASEFAYPPNAQQLPQTMATTLLQQAQHPFSQLGNHYNEGIYAPYTGQQTTNTNSGSDLPGSSTSEQQVHYTSPPRWTTQQAVHRRTSKSPNIQDRTPIRHSRPDMSRHRSTSRPEVLMAYAHEQARQVQPDVSRTLYVPSIDSAGPSYQPHQYGYPPATSPYMHQQPYFESATAHPNYSQISAQQSPPNTTNMYPPGRNELQLPQVPGSSLNPTDTVYNQQRPAQLPPMPSVPSNFPPIPQPLESTHNDVDVVGSRQKPQCWDHGCNGRQFSTFSNLLRHQREKSGTATKARCPHCGTEFTRTTARNGHLYGGKCKGMPEGGKEEGKAEKDETP